MAGKFVTIDGKPVFIGGASQGAGGTSQMSGKWSSDYDSFEELIDEEGEEYAASMI